MCSSLFTVAESGQLRYISRCVVLCHFPREKSARAKQFPAPYYDPVCIHAKFLWHEFDRSADKRLQTPLSQKICGSHFFRFAANEIPNAQTNKYEGKNAQSSIVVLPCCVFLPTSCFRFLFSCLDWIFVVFEHALVCTWCESLCSMHESSLVCKISIFGTYGFRAAETAARCGRYKLVVD